MAPTMSPPERRSHVTRGSSGNRQSGRSTSGSRKKRCISGSEESVVDKKRKKPNRIEDEEPIIQGPATSTKRESDTFCWTCHNIVVPEETSKFRCPDCPRIYHNKCLKKTKGNQVCECKWTTTDGSYSKTNDYHDLRTLLRLSFHAVIKESPHKSKELNNDSKQYLEHFQMWPEYEENELLCQIIDFSIITEKIQLSMYKCTGQFFQDIKWIHHNSYIISPDHKPTSVAQKLEKAVKQQLSYAEGCAECYLGSDADTPMSESFVRVCRNPHVIVWAKLKGFPYWPAKCLRIINGSAADVRFFGTHDKSLLPLAQIYKISIQNPGGCPKQSKTYRKYGYEQAMVELSEYIKNYEDRFGPFIYFNEKTPLVKASKKGRSKKRQNKNKNQNGASSNTNANNDAENGDSSDIEIIETRGPGMRSFPLKNLGDESNEASCESVVDSNVVCHMTFIAEDPIDLCSDEENDIASYTKSLFSSFYYQDSETDIKNSQQLHANLPSFQISQNSTAVAEISSDASSGIASTSSSISPPLVITSTCSLSNSFSDENSDILSNSGSENLIESQVCLKNSPENVSQPSTSSIVPIDDDDDDIQIIEENARPLEETLQNNPLVKAFCELLLANKPQVRHCVQNFQAMALGMYLLMWIDVNKSRFEDFNHLNDFYENMAKRMIVLTSQNATLKREIAELKNNMPHKERKLKLRDLIVKKHVENVALYKKEVRRLHKESSVVNAHFRRLSLDQKRKINELGTLLRKKDESIKSLKKQNDELVKLQKGSKDLIKKSEEFVKQDEIEKLKKKNRDLKNQQEIENLRKKEEELVKLQDDFKNLTKQNEELVKLQEEIKSVTKKNRELANQQEEIKKLKNEELVVQQKEMKKLKKQNEELMKLQEEIKSVTKKNKELGNQQKEMKKITKKNQELVKLKEEIKSLIKKNEELMVQQKEIKNLRKNNKELADQQKEIDNLRKTSKELSKQQEEIVKLRKKNEELENQHEEIENLRKKNEELENQHEEMEKLRKKNEELENQHEEIEILRKKNEELENQHEEIEKLRKKNEELVNQKEEIKNLTTKNKKFVDQQKEIEKLSKENEKIVDQQKEIEKLRKENEDLVDQQKEIEKLRKENEKLVDQQKEIEKLRKEKEKLVDQEKEIEKLRKEKEKFVDHQKEIEKLKKENEKLVDQQKEIEKLRKENEKLVDQQKEIEKLRKENEKLVDQQKEIEKLKKENEMLVDQQKEIQNLRKENEMLVDQQKEIQNLRKGNEELTNQLIKLEKINKKNEVFANQQEIEKLRKNKELGKLQEEIQNLRKEKEEVGNQQKEMENLKRKIEELVNQQKDINNEKDNEYKTLLNMYENLETQSKDELTKREKVILELNRKITAELGKKKEFMQSLKAKYDERVQNVKDYFQNLYEKCVEKCSCGSDDKTATAKKFHRELMHFKHLEFDDGSVEQSIQSLSYEQNYVCQPKPVMETVDQTQLLSQPTYLQDQTQLPIQPTYLQNQTQLPIQPTYLQQMSQSLISIPIWQIPVYQATQGINSPEPTQTSVDLSVVGQSQSSFAMQSTTPNSQGTGTHLQRTNFRSQRTCSRSLRTTSRSQSAGYHSQSAVSRSQSASSHSQSANSRSQSASSRSQIISSRSQITGSRSQITGSRSQITSFCSQSTGSRSQRTGTHFQSTSFHSKSTSSHSQITDSYLKSTISPKSKKAPRKKAATKSTPKVTIKSNMSSRKIKEDIASDLKKIASRSTINN